MPKYIGTSLSECVADILDDKKSIGEVMLIHSNTGVFFFEEFYEQVKHYTKTHWGNREQEAKEVLETLWNAGRILQRGLAGMHRIHPSQVNWIKIDVHSKRKRKRNKGE